MSLQPFNAHARKKRKGSKKAAQSAAMAAGGAASGVIEIPQEVESTADNTITIDEATGAVQIDHEDGSITIDTTGQSLWESPEDGDDSFGANLADKIDPIELNRIANEILDAIQSDKRDRSSWEQMRAKSIELLGMKLEDPKADVSRSSLGVSTSVVRDPVLLEAVERFRANAYAELCPSSGPVKVVNYSTDKQDTDGLAEALQKDLNFYLTTTASEYYPDTRYMLWWTGLASGTFKKVYKCPLRNRPVSEYVDGTDLIVPSSATDLKNSPRVTHQVSMPRDIMRAMQIEGVYRDVILTDPMQSMPSAVAAKLANVEGKAPQPQRIEDQEYTVYECYCKIDIKGYEHKVKGKPTGLPLPYRVTIEETSRQVLEVRRNWAEDDSDETYRPPQIPFVLFPYSTGISRIYGSGLGQMMGNMASALTALLRISIDNGMMSNYPGLLRAKGTGRQVQNEIMVPPGGVAEIDTGGLPIQQTVMGMPFKDVSQNVVALIEQTRGVAQRLGGTADIPVGEGRQDAPVGTTLAMIEQATKVEGSVHKALHAAQAEEFRLLVELFRDDPEALWRGNKRPAMGNAADDAARAARIEKFKRALEDCNIQPMADPNVQSGMQRNLMAAGLKQFAAGNPLYDQVKVDRYVAKQLFKMSDNDFNTLLAPPQMGPPQIDPVVQAQLQLEGRKVDVQEAKVGLDAQKVQVAAHNAEADRALRENVETMKLASHMAAQGNGQPAAVPESPAGRDPIEVAKLAMEGRKIAQKDAELAFKAANAHLDRQSKETIETLKLSQAIAVHPGSDPLVDQQLEQMSAFMKPAAAPARKNGGRMASGGRVGYADGGAINYWNGAMPNASAQVPSMFGVGSGLPSSSSVAGENVGAPSAPWLNPVLNAPRSSQPTPQPAASSGLSSTPFVPPVLNSAPPMAGVGAASGVGISQAPAMATPVLMASSPTGAASQPQPMSPAQLPKMADTNQPSMSYSVGDRYADGGLVGERIPEDDTIRAALALARRLMREHSGSMH